MQIIKHISELKHQLKKEDKTIGFVPTMGSLHEGHISLIKNARKENEIVVVSIFLNPTQFLAGEDLEKYPRKDESDKKICHLCDVDYLFMPDISTMYGNDEILLKAPKINGFILEGEKRAGHFDGVLQVVLKLFNIVNPTKAYFGKKDAQQLALIQQMVKNLYLDISIVACEICREPSGLAMSSRNVYLTQDEKEEALKISKSINFAAKAVGKLELNSDFIIKNMKEILKSERIEIEYIQIVNRNFKILQTVEIQNSIILVAVRIGNTRLIDNIWL